MPYKNLSDLPKSVRQHLPKHAQEIYWAAYNSAWEEYDQDEARWSPTGLWPSHRVAWAAVKHKYEKNEETSMWEEKE